MLPQMRQRLVDEARTWVGTPFQHMQCLKSHGVDCCQIVGGVGMAVGLLTREQVKSVPYYSLQTHLHRSDSVLLTTLLSLGFTEVPKESVLPGDVLLFQYARAIAHSGIYLGGNLFVHAPSSGIKKANIVRLQGDFKDRLRKVMVYPGIID